MASATDDPIVAALFAFWESTRGERAMPAIREVDPLRLGGRLLPHLMLIDLVEGGARLRYRLCGTAVAEAAGADLTGMHVDELNPNPVYTQYIDGLYRRCMAERRPVYSESRYLAHLSSGLRVTRRLICPLSDGGDTIVRFVSAQTFVRSGTGLPPTVTVADEFESGPVQVI